VLGADGQPAGGEPTVGSSIVVIDDDYVGDDRHHAGTAAATDHLECEQELRREGRRHRRDDQAGLLSAGLLAGIKAEACLGGC
jgi:hypothetical protein